MQETRATFQEHIKRTDATSSFRFLPEEKIDFIPGQFLQVVFDENDKKNRELNKYLSFSSAPMHAYIEVTKRLSESAFSKKLLSLQKGDTVLLKAPMGNCVLCHTSKKIGFIIGGIGIAPVISIVEDVVSAKNDFDVILMYSNRSRDDIAFKNELDVWAGESDRFHLCYAVDEGEPVEEGGCVGFVTQEAIQKEIPDYKERNIFIFGPPAMVGAIKNMCLEIGCDSEKIKSENFIGY